MKKLRFPAVLFSLLICFILVFQVLPMGMATVAAAVDWYVATDGDDEGDGSQANPWLTIQHAIDSAGAGDTVNVEGGTYNEQVTINKHVSIIGSGTVPTIITGGDPVLLLAAGGTETQPLLLQDLHILGVNGIRTDATPISYVALQDVDITASTPDTGIGFQVATGHSLTYFSVVDSVFEGFQYGLYDVKTPGTGDSGTKLQYVTITTTIFRDNHEKGMYVESLSDATFADVQFIDNGVFPGAVELSEKMGAGLDINLKDGTYSNLTFNDLIVTGNGLLTPYGAGIMIKARGTGLDSSYSSWPATLTNVTFNGGTFTGNERGIRFGEPGMANTGPTNVTIHNASISGNVQTYEGEDGSAYGGVVNETTPTVDATYNWWGAASGPGPVGPGSGDSVSVNVYYAPWYTDAARVTLVPVHNVTKDTYYLTIQAAIDAATAGDTINAAAGTYVETVTINKTLTLNGANAGISAGATPGTRGPESIIQGGVQIQANNVVFDGFEIDGPGSFGGVVAGIYIVGSTSGHTISNNVLAGTDSSGSGPYAMVFGYYTSAVTVNNNDIGNWRSTYINPTNIGSNLLFEGNNFHDNYAGIGSDGIKDLNIQSNKFTNNTNEGFGSGDYDSVSSGVHVNNNDFVGNGAGISNLGVQAIDATNNSWGDVSGPYNAAYNSLGLGDDITGNVSFIPWTDMPSPTVSLVSPSQGLPGDSLTGAIVSGTYFNGATNVSFGAGITVSNLIVNSSGTQIAVDLSIDAGAATGPRDVSVTTPAIPGTGVLPDGFRVSLPSEPPVATNDAYDVNYATTLTVAAPGVLANDSDPDSDPLTAVLLSGTSYGQLTLHSDGSFEYTPNTGHQGGDSFTYRAFDGAGYSNSATVTLTMDPASLNPVANDDSYSERFGTTITAVAPGILGNDTDPQSDPLTAVLVSGVSYGQLTFNSDGSFVYVPNPDFQGTDTFTYQAFDGVRYSNTATVNLTERPPYSPLLISPDNGAQVAGANVTFQWETVIGSVSYRLLVSTSTNITDTTKHKCDVNVGSAATYLDTGYPCNGTKYYWWVWAYAADGTPSPWSEVSANSRSFTSVPSVATPTLVSPTNGASMPGTTVGFEWGSVPGAVDYKLLVSTSTNIFDATKYKRNVNMGSGAITTYVDTGYPANNTKYYWWVWAYGADGFASLWSEVSANSRNFTSVPSVVAPTLVSPANGASIVGGGVVDFQWGVVAGAVDYRLLVSTSTNIMDATKYKYNALVGNVTTYHDTGYPGASTKYYWWVWAFAADGSSSLWSQVSANSRSFTYAGAYVPAPPLLSPENGASIATTSVTFEWGAVSGAVDYKLLVSTSTKFLDATKYKRNVNVGNATTYVDTGYLANGTTYYWWVWAYTADGSCSAWSEVSANGRTFTSVPSVGAPTLVSPDNNASVSGASVTFQWNAVSGAVNYRLLVSTSTNILDATKYKCSKVVGNVLLYVDTGYPANGTVYYWWVWAYAADGSSSLWSAVSANGRSFTNVA